jgi:predicted transcriptional regulator
MPEIRFKPKDKIKHILTGDVLTFKAYGTGIWEGWAVVTHAHGTASSHEETWWRLEECQLSNAEIEADEPNTLSKEEELRRQLWIQVAANAAIEAVNDINAPAKWANKALKSYDAQFTPEHGEGGKG